MFGGTRHTGLIGGVLLAAYLLSPGAAFAADADFGCCADLEERVAELEATTARKGNRVVSLQISGSVNQALVAWDDGVDSDAYIVSNTGYQSRINFTGTGRINSDVTAGYVLTLGIWGSPSMTVDQVNDESVSPSPLAQPDSVIIRESKGYIESARFGRVTLGQQSVASDDITAINVARSVYVDSSAQQVFVGGYQLRDGDALTGLRYLNLMGSDGTNPPGDGQRYDAIRYDSPSMAGFKVSASWGEDDMWDVALRYAGLLGGRFKAAAGVSYSAFTDGDPTASATPTFSSGVHGCTFDAERNVDCHMIGMSGSIMDMGTGLFIHGAYGVTTDENKPDGFDNETSFYYLHGGIEKKWLPYGSTTLFAVYGQFNTGFERALLSPTSFGQFENGEVEMWGIGINQYFESAGLDVYLKYNEYTASAENVSITGGAARDIDFNDFSVIYAGARVSF